MRLERTPHIDAFLQGVHTVQLDEGVGPAWIDHSLLIDLAKRHHKSLGDLVKGSGVYFEPPPSRPPPSPEYEELMARLRAEEQERQYRLLVQESEPSTQLAGSELKEVKEQLTTILNIMVSIVAIAWAFWYWTASWDLAARTLASLFAGIGIGVAETVVYLGYKRRVTEARATERAATEKRTVVKRIVFEKGSEKIMDAEPSVDTPRPAVSTGANKPTSSELRSRKPVKS